MFTFDVALLNDKQQPCSSDVVYELRCSRFGSLYDVCATVTVLPVIHSQASDTDTLKLLLAVLWVSQRSGEGQSVNTDYCFS